MSNHISSVLSKIRSHAARGDREIAVAAATAAYSEYTDRVVAVADILRGHTREEARMATIIYSAVVTAEAEVLRGAALASDGLSPSEFDALRERIESVADDLCYREPDLSVELATCVTAMRAVRTTLLSLLG